MQKDNFEAKKRQSSEEIHEGYAQENNMQNPLQNKNRFCVGEWFVEDEEALQKRSRQTVNTGVYKEANTVLSVPDVVPAEYGYVDNSIDMADTDSSGYSQKKYLRIIAISVIIMLVLVIIILFFGPTLFFHESDKITQHNPVATQKIVRTTQAPVMEEYRLYIDEQNESAYTLLEWTPVEGNFDGYEIEYGISENAYPGIDAKWTDSIIIDDSTVYTHKIDLEYASDNDIDMARIRVYYYEEGEKNCGEWSDIIYLDNNRIIG